MSSPLSNRINMCVRYISLSCFIVSDGFFFCITSDDVWLEYTVFFLFLLFFIRLYRLSVNRRTTFSMSKNLCPQKCGNEKIEHKNRIEYGNRVCRVYWLLLSICALYSKFRHDLCIRKKKFKLMFCRWIHVRNEDKFTAHTLYAKN